MNFLKVLVIASLLFIFCGSVYGVNEADSLDIQGVDVDGNSDTVIVENANLTYDKLIINDNGEEVVIGDNSIWDIPIKEGPIVENDNTSVPDISLKDEMVMPCLLIILQMYLSMNPLTSKWYLRI